MRTLPSGTVTLLFTDIEGSTRLLQELGEERFNAALEEHRRILRDAFVVHNGIELRTEGDSFFAAFASARAALAAAAAAQQELTSSPLQVRIGLHTGEPLPVEHEDGYVGLDVHRAARICAAAHGGQVLLSRATRDLLGEQCDLHDLGEHRLKDFDEPVWIFQLGTDEFPPLKSLSNTNLPTPATGLVGRARELAEIAGLLRREEVRLLTLTGPGGTGKTRLALALGRELLRDFSNGVFFVGLAPLVDPALVAPRIAQVLAVKERGGQPLLDLLCEHVADKSLLLLVDNCEHLLEAVPVLSELLAAAPGLTILATSRERLHLSGEHDFPLTPLVEDEALELFAARARAALPSFSLDGDRDEVGEICRRLDCLPLAIELAAARVRVLSPHALLGRLEQRLLLLTGGASDAPARHRTLQATIAWSYELLEPQEQELFTRLAIFAGGCTLEAAEEVCEADFEMLCSLVDKSLLRQEQGPESAPRFAMLETIREYATERLEDSGGAEELRRRHAQHFLELARQADRQLRDGDQAAWLETLEAEHDNFRVILGRPVGDLQLELAGALGRFWLARGHLEEGLKWLRKVLGRASRKPALRAQALHAAASLAFYKGDRALVRPHAEEALELFEAAGDPAGVAGALINLGNTSVLEGDYKHGQSLLERAQRAAAEAGDRLYGAMATQCLGDLALQRGDYERALALFQEVLALVESEELRSQDEVAITLFNVAFASFRLGRNDEAARRSEESLVALRDVGTRHPIANFLVLPAALAAARGHPGQAVCLLAMADAHVEAGAAPFFPAEQKLYGETLALVRGQLNPERFARARAEGEAIFSDAIAHALRSLADAPGAIQR